MYKDIERFKGLYKISDDGKVLSVKRNKILKPKINMDIVLFCARRWYYE